MKKSIRALEAWDKGTIAIGDKVVSALVDTPTEIGTIIELVGAPYAPGAEVEWAAGRISYWTLAELNMHYTPKIIAPDRIQETDTGIVCFYYKRHAAAIDREIAIKRGDTVSPLTFHNGQYEFVIKD